MLYSIKNREDWENLNKLVSLNNQIEELRLQGELGKHKFHKKIKEVFEPVIGTKKITSEKLTETVTDTAIKNTKALEYLNHQFLEKLKDRGIIASCFLSPLTKITKPENTNEFKLVKDCSSNGLTIC